MCGTQARALAFLAHLLALLRAPDSLQLRGSVSEWAQQRQLQVGRRVRHSVRSRQTAMLGQTACAPGCE